MVSLTQAQKDNNLTATELERAIKSMWIKVNAQGQVDSQDADRIRAYATGYHQALGNQNVAQQ